MPGPAVAAAIPAVAAGLGRMGALRALQGWLARFAGKQGLRQLGNPEFLGSNIGASALFMAPWMLMGSGGSSSPDQQEMFRNLADFEGGMPSAPPKTYGRV